MLTGKGMYIWKIKNVEGGDGNAASIAALNAGLTHVLIKVLDGPWAYNQRPVYDGSGEFERLPRRHTETFHAAVPG